MPQTVTIEVYGFKELSEEAQEYAIEQYQKAEWDSGHIAQWSVECAVESFREFAKECGINLASGNPNNSGDNGGPYFDCHHRSFGINGQWYPSDMVKESTFTAGALKGVFDAFQKLAEDYPGMWASFRVEGYHDHLVTEVHDFADEDDESISGPEWDAMENTIEARVEDIMGDLAHWLFNYVDTDMEYALSDEVIREHLSEGVEFRQDGSLHR